MFLWFLTAMRELIDALEKTPDTIAELVDDFSQANLRRRNSAGEFSAIENVCHLRDIEIEATHHAVTEFWMQRVPFFLISTVGVWQWSTPTTIRILTWRFRRLPTPAS